MRHLGFGEYFGVGRGSHLGRLVRAVQAGVHGAGWYDDDRRGRTRNADRWGGRFRIALITAVHLRRPGGAVLAAGGRSDEIRLLPAAGE